MQLALFMNLFCFLIFPVFGQIKGLAISAQDPFIHYLGRTVSNPDGTISMDWPGSAVVFNYEGFGCSIQLSESGESYYNLFVNNEFQRVITVKGGKQNIELVKSNKKKKFVIRLQKRSEGEYGRLTIHRVLLSDNSKLIPLAQEKKPIIEFIGDSYTCGYGVEDPPSEQTFVLKSENVDKTYAAILSRYFNTDFVAIAHSGKGASKNYGQETTSGNFTMKDVYFNALNSDTSKKWEAKSYRPDLIVIYLGSNDFSTNPKPSGEEFIDAYSTLIKHIRSWHSDVPILCVSAAIEKEIPRYLQVMKEELNDSQLFITESLSGIINSKTDLGGVGHPNYQGHRKIASFLAPYLSTIKNWDFPNSELK